MAHQPKYEPQHRSGFFNDGRAARLPVPGTVPIGFNLEGRYFQTEGNNLVDGTGGFTNQPDYFNTGRMGDVYGDGIPEKLAAKGGDLLRRGQQRFDIYCAVCHGVAGQGNGVAKSFGLITVRALLDDLLRAQPDGQIFNTITHGKNTMGAYGPVIAVEDRWAIVAYVRALQASAAGRLASLPEAEQKKLQQQK
jgi:mono/diheme cytochrome c family protein